MWTHEDTHETRTYPKGKVNETEMKRFILTNKTRAINQQQPITLELEPRGWRPRGVKSAPWHLWQQTHKSEDRSLLKAQEKKRHRTSY